MLVSYPYLRGLLNFRKTYLISKLGSGSFSSNRRMSVQEKYSFPNFVQDRINLFDEIKKEYDNFVSNQPLLDISIRLPDGSEKHGISWRTTPFEIAKGISDSLANNAIISKVNNELWDLDRPFEDSCSLEILTFDSDEGQQVFWHSSAHILGEAMESKYQGCLCYGPPIENGFYYDMFMDNNQVSSNDFKYLEEFCKDVAKDKQKFIRLEMTKEQLREMFKYNEFKLRIINEKIDTDKTTVYRCGPLIDLCRGPHVRHTGLIKALSVTKSSSTYWEGNSERETLQRVYGISFPNSKLLSEYKKFQEEAAKRDHRKLGKEHELFFFHELSPGSCFFHPKGAHIYNKLIEFIKSEYHKRGFQEVITPNIYNIKLWQTSGHWLHYAENMFSFESEKENFALKPMNCPGHCLMFAHRTRSWKELPIRMADFGVLHRNELSGTLTGLTRVRRFCQDDAHIFCSIDQVKQEINSCLNFLISVYKVFGFSIKLNLSTRPEKYLGSLEIWDRAEKELKDALDSNELSWVINPGDGAFYGPKIDIQIQDALKRYHQCATIQLDFNLPERFDLNYITNEGTNQRPVIIHRAILGSVERMIAILTENFAGKWPFWLSPNQVAIICVNESHSSYANHVIDILHHDHITTTLYDDPSLSLNKKIRNAQLAQHNYIFVIGDKEMSSETVNVRSRQNKQFGERSIDNMLVHFKKMVEDKLDDSTVDFDC